MNHIITIGREFGSGGREFGKHLADTLGVAYFDKEIVAEIAKRTKLAEDYVSRIVEQKPGMFFPITVGRTLHATGSDYMIRQFTSVYAEQTNVLREMAEKGDCVIVGRCADYILREMKPFRIFIYADLDSRVARCRKMAEGEEPISEREMRSKIISVDKSRAKYYQYYTGQMWGDRANYDLCINTTGLDIARAAEILAELSKQN